MQKKVKFNCTNDWLKEFNFNVNLPYSNKRKIGEKITRRILSSLSSLTLTIFIDSLMVEISDVNFDH